MTIGIAKPFIGEEEKREVLAVLESGQLVQGEWVSRFEQEFARLQGTKHAVATSSGTAALMSALMAHGIGPGDEVIVPSFSFFATASCVLGVHAIPVFADVEPDTFTLSPESAASVVTSKTKAIMPVHLYGQPANMSAFAQLCAERNLILLEDAAQAHLAAIDGRPVGTFGTASFSFYPSKNAMAGEGGIVTTSDDTIAQKLRMIRNQGMSQTYVHEVVGFNFRMTNLCAAIGLPQLARLEKWTEKRIENASYLRENLRGVTSPREVPGYRHVYHQFTIRVPEGMDRDAMVNELNKRGVGARVYYPTPIHRQPIMQKLGYGNAELPVTDRLCQSVLSLPVHPFLTREELQSVAAEVNRLC